MADILRQARVSIKDNPDLCRNNISRVLGELAVLYFRKQKNK